MTTDPVPQLDRDVLRRVYAYRQNRQLPGLAVPITPTVTSRLYMYERVLHNLMTARGYDRAGRPI
jgi:hypothetical protein